MPLEDRRTARLDGRRKVSDLPSNFPLSAYTTDSAIHKQTVDEMTNDTEPASPNATNADFVPRQKVERSVMLHNRKIRNRASAARSRERKKLSLEFIMEEVTNIREMIEQLKSKYAFIVDLVGECNASVVGRAKRKEQESGENP